MKIGMIQMDAAAGHMEHNIAHGFELMEEAAEHSDLGTERDEQQQHH